MARRSALKRIIRIGSNLKKTSLRLARKAEKNTRIWAIGTAGPELVQKTSVCCNEGKPCVCKLSFIEFCHVKASCVPNQITRFKQEYSYFKQKIRNPGTIVMGDLFNWPYAIFYALVCAYIGTCLGRWNLWGYSYDREKDFNNLD